MDPTEYSNSVEYHEQVSHVCQDPKVPLPLFYGDSPDDDPLRSDDDLSPGQDISEETLQHLEKGVQEAFDNGLPEELQEQMCSLLHEFRVLFRTKLGADPPANVTPMTIKLKPDAKPIRAKLRGYSPPQAELLRKRSKKLYDSG